MLEEPEKHVFLPSLLAGAGAALAVDIAVFPLDTITTRLQSSQGLSKTGGFKSLYKGIGPQAMGSVPQAALFFLTYESFKSYAEPRVESYALPLVHMTAASASEVVACSIGVPMEVIKQRRQTSTRKKHTSVRIFMHAIRSEGLKGLYRGYGSMVLVDIPFSFIQFPVLEYLKKVYRVNVKNNIALASWEVASCGAFAGGFAAALTTPFDVAKTRIMLADKKSAINMNVGSVLKQLYYENGLKGLYAGFTPRVMCVTLGGFIFFGTYDLLKNFCGDYLLNCDLEVNR